MKDPEHPDITFKAGSLGRFVRKYKIYADISPVDPAALEEGPRVRRTRWFIASLEKGGRTYTSQIEFMRYREVLPSIEDVLENVLNTAAGYERLKNDIPLAMKISGWPEDRARQWVEGMATDVHAIKWFLGPEAYAEFLTIQEVRE